MEDLLRELVKLVGLPFILGLPFTLLGTVAAILQVPHVTLRRAMLALFIAALAADGYFLMWWSSHQKDVVVRRVPPPKPSPTPSPRKVEPTPQPSPTPAQSQPESADEITLNSSTFKDGVTRDIYCLDSAFEGRCRRRPNSIEVIIDRARFELCTQSKAPERDIQFKVGIGKNEAVDQRREDLITWGPLITKHITKGEENALDLAPGQLLSINKAKLSKKSPLDLSKYKLIIKVFNPEKRGRYFHTYALD